MFCWKFRAALAAATALASASPALAATFTQTTHVPGAVARHEAALAGPADPASRMTLAVALPMRDLAGLKTLAHGVSDPSSPNFRQYLTVAQFTDRFGPAKADYDAAMQFFGTSGLRVVEGSANRYMIQTEGSVADIERVFHLKLNTYAEAKSGRHFTAPDREPSLDLAVPVLHVGGLDNAVLPTPRLLPPEAGPRAKPQGTGSGPQGYFIGSDMRAAYYGKTKLDGAGQSVSLMELGPYDQADVELYFKTVKQKLNVKVTPIAVGGGNPLCTKCNDGEQTLDIDYAISMAPAMDQVQVFVGGNPSAVLNAMATDTTSKQASTSWGWSENFNVDDPVMMEMAVQGQTLLTASGDNSSLQASGPWPEEDANIVGVGGTDLTTDGAGGAWVGETGWSDSAGGPSVDKSIKIEPYQKPFINKANGGSTVLRNVPDISAAADFNFYICAGGRCVGGYGGTSFSSPIWAGMIALVNQQAAAAGNPTVGFINPALYAIGKKAKKYASTIHDVTSGKSGIFNAVVGYDLVTGLGSMNGQPFINALAGK